MVQRLAQVVHARNQSRQQAGAFLARALLDIFHGQFHTTDRDQQIVMGIHRFEIKVHGQTASLGCRACCN
jgi:fatty acid/phospholipid biosynthesis enzyme